MNKTLFSCGFKKQVETKTGQKYDVTSSQVQNVKLKAKNTLCQFCSATFTAEQYLDTHIQFKHTDVLPAMLPILEKFKDKKNPGDGNNLVRDDVCINPWNPWNPILMYQCYTTTKCNIVSIVMQMSI